jgi:hypothetical protein
MDNDLNVKKAFDSLCENLSYLLKFKEKKMLSIDDSKEVIAEIREIDYVFQAFFRSK